MIGMDAQEGKGCPVLLDAVRRWRAMPEHRRGDYEDFIRRHYWREAQLSDGLVVSLASGDPLTEDEVMQTDLYELAIMYDDGTYSKVWAMVKEKKPVKEMSAAEYKARRVAMYTPLAENPRMYAGTPCKACGDVRKYFSGGCVSCARVREKEHSGKYHIFKK